MTGTTQSIIAMAIKHGASSYTNRTDTQHPAYGFTEAALTAFAQDLLAGQCLHQIAEPTDAPEWKDHQTAQLVGQLTEVAREFHGAQQLRERIAHLIHPLAEKAKAAPAAQAVEPAAVVLPEPVAAESRFASFSGDRWKWCSVEHANAFGEEKGYEVRYLYSEHQVRALLAAPSPAAVAVPDEREAFEAWAEIDYPVRRSFGKQNDYEFVEVRRMWGAWQARASLAATKDERIPAATGPSDAEIAELRKTFGITSDGRGIHEFSKVASFVRSVLSQWGRTLAATPAAPAAAPVVLPEPDRIAQNLMRFVGLDKDTARKCQEVVRCALLAKASAAPIQPVVIAADGCIRFKENRIVSALVDHGEKTGYSLNDIACGDFSDEERMQVAQLIGWSVSGYGGLSYASPQSVAAADAAAEAIAASAAKGGV